jgi:hypothetical protein
MDYEGGKKIERRGEVALPDWLALHRTKHPGKIQALGTSPTDMQKATNDS